MAKRKNAAAPKRPTPVAAEQWGIARKIAWWSLLACVFITPLAISNLTFLGFSLPLTYDQFDIIKVFFQRIFGLIAIGAWAWDILFKGGRIRRTPVDWAVLALIGWVALSTIFSIHPPTALFGKYRRFEGLLSFINYGVLYFLVIQLADTSARIKKLAQALFFSGAIVALYGMLQYLGLDPLQWGQLPFEANRSFSTYGNPDLLGGFLMFSTFVSLGLALAEKHLVWRGVYWFGFLLNAGVIVTAFTRSAWVGSVAGFVIIIIFAIRQRTEWKTEDWVFASVAALAAVIPAVRSLSSQNAVMNFGLRLKSIFQFGEGSAKTRFEIWQAALDSVKARPIFGFGPDTFRLVFPRYKPVGYVKDAGYLSVADNVHNYPLQLASSIGIPGVLLFYGTVGFAAVRSFGVVWKRDAGVNRMVLAGLWTACAAYIVHLLFGLSVTGSSFLLWVCMAAVLSPTAESVEVEAPSWGTVAAGLITAVVLFGVGYQFVYMQADTYYLRARITAQGPQRTAFAEKAAQLNPWNDMYRAEVGLAYSDEVLAAVNAASQGQLDQTTALTNAANAFKKAENSLKDTIKFVPWEYDNYVFLANLYNLGGQVLGNKDYYVKAKEIAEQGVAVERYGPAIRVQYARSLQSLGDVNGAIKQLEFAHDMDPAYSEATLLLAQLLESQGKNTEALKVLQDTETYRPGEPGIADEINKVKGSTAASGTTVTP